MQAFEANGVTKVEPKVGEMMDPNLHEAMFDIPNPNQDPGTIAVVTKVPISPTCEPQTLCLKGFQHKCNAWTTAC